MPTGPQPAPLPPPCPEPALTATDYLRVFRSRRMGAMLLLGFASGLPLALSSGALQAWLTMDGVDIVSIGMFTLVGLPYTFKFVWAPLMDRFEPPWAGRRRGWLLVTQLGLAAACWALAALDPRTQMGALAAAAVALAFLSASQDVVFDAYRADLLAPDERGAGAAVSVLGYRLAMLVSGGLALVVADRWLGWPDTYRLMGALFAAIALVAWASAPRVAPVAPRAPGAPGPAPAAAEWRGFAAMVGAALAVYGCFALLPLQALRADRWVRLALDSTMLALMLGAGIVAARTVGFPSFVAPWDAFFARRRALALLALIVLYKLGDAFAGSLTTAFLIRGAGFSATEVGAVNKVWGLAATILGALAGGALLARASLYRALMGFGLLQAVSNLAYLGLALLPARSLWTMAAAVAVENLCGGLGTAAFVAFLMALTDARFSAAQFALLSALSAVARVYVGPTAGVLVAAFGWPTFFVFTVAAALPGLALLWWLRREVDAADARERAAAGPAGAALPGDTARPDERPRAHPAASPRSARGRRPGSDVPGS